MEKVKRKTIYEQNGNINIETQNRNQQEIVELTIRTEMKNSLQGFKERLR